VGPERWSGGGRRRGGAEGRGEVKDNDRGGS
jgi:hypothetical protein